MTEYEFNEREEVLPLDISEDLTLEQAEKVLIQTVNYGDYLAAERKKARTIAKDKKKAYKHWKFVYLKKAVGGDAKAREAEAEDNAQLFFDEYDSAEIEADYIKDLLGNNHDKTEALRTIVSSKKTVWEKTMNSRQT